MWYVTFEEIKISPYFMHSLVLLYMPDEIHMKRVLVCFTSNLFTKAELNHNTCSIKMPCDVAARMVDNIFIDQNINVKRNSN